ncbi:hypothetical protein LHGZ1_0837 [Laribacter hongkongensis]|uniref:Uncharacterized protein n=1 Tax=Laribacter hongkongensis TaxID=168471 RepID=A0A248LFT9_9NEIS|nr:hypothetical protein LHGZ1_0837 [Laribacter hongkongensis]
MAEMFQKPRIPSQIQLGILVKQHLHQLASRHCTPRHLVIMPSRLPQMQSLLWTSRSTSTANRSEFDTVYAYRHSNHPSADQYFWQILPRYSRIPDHSAGQLWGSRVRKQHKADKQKKP